jgi:hypothetical protein
VQFVLRQIFIKKRIFFTICLKRTVPFISRIANSQGEQALNTASVVLLRDSLYNSSSHSVCIVTLITERGIHSALKEGKHFRTLWFQIELIPNRTIDRLSPHLKV